ncbi:hypothetical protein Poly51_34680 [Rubripirellula tenax]|uniref:Uncharacterized protein n=1 Tax=Rubripirellula tenax TaxID=2528015 RepID=A0A5C6F4L0_9BACT|nr:hypothetical protein Poly51_34680 [Rubripirellula tenax]
MLPERESQTTRLSPATVGATATTRLPSGDNAIWTGSADMRGTSSRDCSTTVGLRIATLAWSVVGVERPQPVNIGSQQKAVSR